MLWSTASPAPTRKASSGRPCCRHVATTVSSRSAKRLPASLSDPKLPFRHSTAGRTSRRLNRCRLDSKTPTAVRRGYHIGSVTQMNWSRANSSTATARVQYGRSPEMGKTDTTATTSAMS